MSATAGGVLWAVTHEAWALPVTVAAGVAVDVDHGPDLWWASVRGRQPVATKALHGWEWLGSLIVLGALAGFEWWLVAVTVGYGLHLTTDHLFNGGHAWNQSFIFRARHGFRLDRPVPDLDLEHTDTLLRKEVPVAVNLIDRWRSHTGRRDTNGPQPQR